MPREEFELPRDLGHVNAVPRTPTREPGQAHRLLVARHGDCKLCHCRKERFTLRTMSIQTRFGGGYGVDRHLTFRVVEFGLCGLVFLNRDSEGHFEDTHSVSGLLQLIHEGGRVTLVNHVLARTLFQLHHGRALSCQGGGKAVTFVFVWPLVARAVLHFFAASSGLVATRTADGSEFRAFRIAFSMVMGALPF